MLNISPYTSLGMDIGCADQKTWNNDNMLSFAQQNFQYSLQTREKSSWKTLGGFATSCFSLGFFSRLSVNICQYRFADLSILSHYSYQTDVTRVSTGRGKNLYGQPSLGVVGDSHSSRSNDITLALALLQRFYSPRVSGSTSGKPFGGCAPSGFSLGWSLHTQG